MSHKIRTRHGNPSGESNNYGARSRSGHSFRGADAAVEGMPSYQARESDAVSGLDLRGETVTEANVKRGTLTRELFASGISVPAVVAVLPVLPDASYEEGSLVFLTTDGKLYRNVADAWTVAVDGADVLANSITAGQIAAGAIGTSELSAAAIIQHVENSDSSVVIDENGITILNGKISLLDAAGNSVLSAAGFDGSWRSFISSGGIYNSDFEASTLGALTETLVSGADSNADYAASLSPLLPYWWVGLTGSNMALAVVNDAIFGHLLEFTGAFDDGLQHQMYVSQDVPALADTSYVIWVLWEFGAGSQWTYTVVDAVDDRVRYLRVKVGAEIDGTSRCKPMVKYRFRNATHGAVGASETTVYPDGFGLGGFGQPVRVMAVRISPGKQAFRFLRLTSTVDASPTSTDHAFSIGDEDAGIRMDSNEIMRVGGALLLQADGSEDVQMFSSANGIRFDGAQGYIEMGETADVGLADANHVRIYARDNGAGKTQIAARFPSGGAVVIATEP